MDHSETLINIPVDSLVVFDWDNTLKIYDKTSRTIRCRFERDLLCGLKQRGCELFIISAIAPRKMALETLVFEVKKLGLEDLFAGVDSPFEIKAGSFARKGNIIACGYDKAETFLELTKELAVSPDKAAKGRIDNKDGAVDEADGGDLEIDGPISMDSLNGPRNKRTVVFFDDEEVNILNFREIVKDSICHHVV